MNRNYIVEQIRKFFEEQYYQLLLAALLFLRAILDNPALSGIVQNIPWLKSLLGDPSWEQAFTSAVLMSITLGVYLNGRKLEHLDTSILSEAKNFGLHLPRVQSLRRRDNNFAHIARKMLDEQRTVISKLAQGVFSIQLELMEKMQAVFMEVFHNRMDAASYDDLELWRHIHQQSLQAAAYEGKDFDSDVGRKYYNKILEMKELHRTVVTRVLVLKRDEAQKDIETVARVIKQHVDDGIGVALAFADNLHVTTHEWFNTGELSASQPRIDFALFDNDRAVTFFRKNSTPQRFEAVVSLNDWTGLINQQREAHKTLLVASVFATQQFYDLTFKDKQFKRGAPKTVGRFYSNRERQEISRVIDYIREKTAVGPAGAAGQPQEWAQMFSVTLSDAEYEGKAEEEQLRIIREKVEKSVTISKDFRDNVHRFTKLLSSLKGQGGAS